jgi:protein PhnA
LLAAKDKAPSEKSIFSVIFKEADNPGLVLTRSLDVKGSTVHARLGTVIRNIRLVADNTGQIEGRIEGQLITILPKYVRKQGS